MTTKLILGIFTGLFTLVFYFPYYRDIFKKKTTPHLYTWLIWTVTQGTATAGILYGGGKYGAIGWIVSTLVVGGVFLLSFRYGTKNIRTIDTVSLVAAIIAIVIWWFSRDALVAVIMVSAIDTLGYIPTIRKTYEEPQSETPLFWFLVTIGSVLSLLANAQYNILTTLYPVTLGVLSGVVWLVCVYRRKKLAL